MNLDKVAFYNLGALEEIPGHGRNGLVRVPKNIRNKLNKRARWVGMDSTGIEVRFVSDATVFDLYVSCLKPEFGNVGRIRVYCGHYLINTLEIEPGILRSYRIEKNARFNHINNNMLCFQGGFAPNVWRIVFERATFAIQGIDVFGYEMRPPKIEELPRLDWLAYGSSITNSNLDGYVHIAASRLHTQVQNMGFSGACQIEKELIDYMFDNRTFDFVTMELGINMRNAFTPDQFRERADYAIKRIVDMKKPAWIITIFPNWGSEKYTLEMTKESENEIRFNEILEELVKEINCDSLHLIHGEDILTDVSGLRGDLVHPTEYGHAIMGMNLANKLNNYI